MILGYLLMAHRKSSALLKKMRKNPPENITLYYSAAWLSKKTNIHKLPYTASCEALIKPSTPPEVSGWGSSKDGGTSFFDASFTPTGRVSPAKYAPWIFTCKLLLQIGMQSTCWVVYIYLFSCISTYKKRPKITSQRKEKLIPTDTARQE